MWSLNSWLPGHGLKIGSSPWTALIASQGFLIRDDVLGNPSAQLITNLQTRFRNRKEVCELHTTVTLQRRDRARGLLCPEEGLRRGGWALGTCEERSTVWENGESAQRTQLPPANPRGGGAGRELGGGDKMSE